MPDGHTHPAPDFFPMARQIVGEQQVRRDAHPGCGVSWSGLQREPPRVETVEAVAERLERREADRAAFRASPRGRFLTAVEALEEDHPAEASALQTHYAHFYYSGFGEPGERVQVAAVGRALLVLAPMDCMLAQDAEMALGDLLIADAAKAVAL
jgi:hypothetical protein